jgi:hypothetical protein
MDNLITPPKTEEAIQSLLCRFSSKREGSYYCLRSSEKKNAKSLFKITNIEKWKPLD